MNDISVRLKKAITEALEGLGATKNGTEIQAIVGSGADSYDEYPVIRVIPSGVMREVNAEERSYTYTVNFMISLYLNLNDADYPDEGVIETMAEFIDKIFDRLDGYDYNVVLPENSKMRQESSIISNIDTVETKNGSALYCDIEYPLSITIAF